MMAECILPITEMDRLSGEAKACSRYLVWQYSQIAEFSSYVNIA